MAKYQKSPTLTDLCLKRGHAPSDLAKQWGVVDKAALIVRCAKEGLAEPTEAEIKAAFPKPPKLPPSVAPKADATEAAPVTKPAKKTKDPVVKSDAADGLDVADVADGKSGDAKG